MSCRTDVPNSLDCGIFRISRLQMFSETVKIQSDPRDDTQAPLGMARWRPRLSCSNCSERFVREPAAFHVRSRDRLDVVAENPDCHHRPFRTHLLLPRWFPYIFLIVPKTASMMLRWQYSSMNLSRSSLCIRVMSSQAGLPAFLPAVFDLPDALQHALLGYGIADLPDQVGRVQAEEAAPLFNPAQHRPHSGDVGGVPVGDRVVKDGPSGTSMTLCSLTTPRLSLTWLCLMLNRWTNLLLE